MPVAHTTETIIAVLNLLSDAHADVNPRPHAVRAFRLLFELKIHRAVNPLPSDLLAAIDTALTEIEDALGSTDTSYCSDRCVTAWNTLRECSDLG